MTVASPLGRQDFGLSRSWDGFAPSLAASETSSADHEATFFRRALVESLDTLFGRDIEWTETQSADTHRLAAHTSVGSTGAVAAVHEAEQPSATLLAVGLALSALWSEGDEDDRVNQPRELMLKRRPVSV
jgi:hypothetical protein